MTPFEKDEFLFALRETMSFYGKDLEPGQVKLWYKALADKPVDYIVRALEAHLQEGKYAPKPVDIRVLIEVDKAQRRQTETQITEHTPCPPEISKAWRWFLHLTTRDTQLEGLFDPVEADDQEKYLRLVNEEAKRCDLPGAIPEEYRLKEIWG